MATDTTLRQRRGARPSGSEVGPEAFTGMRAPRILREAATNSVMDNLVPLRPPSEVMLGGAAPQPSFSMPPAFTPPALPAPSQPNPALRARGGARPAGGEVGPEAFAIERPMPTLANITPNPDVQPQRGVFVGGRARAAGATTLPSPGYEVQQGTTPVIGEASATGANGAVRRFTQDQVAGMANAPGAGLNFIRPPAINQDAIERAKWTEFNARTNANLERMRSGAMPGYYGINSVAIGNTTSLPIRGPRERMANRAVQGGIDVARINAGAIAQDREANRQERDANRRGALELEGVRGANEIERQRVANEGGIARAEAVGESRPRGLSRGLELRHKRLVDAWTLAPEFEADGVTKSLQRARIERELDRIENMDLEDGIGPRQAQAGGTVQKTSGSVVTRRMKDGSIWEFDAVNKQPLRRIS